METFIERTDDKFAIQLSNFCSKIDTYKVLLGLDNTKVTTLKASGDFVGFLITGNPQVQTYAEGFTAYKNLARFGHGTEVLGPMPIAPSLGIAPTATNANIQKDFADMIQDCARSSNFTQTIGEDLGIIKPSSPFNPQNGKPVIKTKLVDSGHPHLHVTKGDFQGFVLYKDSGTGFAKVDKIFHPNYIDHDPLPAPGTSATWRYKAVYMYQDAVVGTESDVAIVVVSGGAA